MKLISISLPATPVSFDISHQLVSTTTLLKYSLSLMSQISGFNETLDISVPVSIRKIRNLTQMNKTKTCRGSDSSSFLKPKCLSRTTCVCVCVCVYRCLLPLCALSSKHRWLFVTLVGSDCYILKPACTLSMHILIVCFIHEFQMP